LELIKLDNVARLVRRALRKRQAVAKFPDIAQDKLPILFANSFPKSGTHLLTQILAGFSKLAPFSVAGLAPVRSFEGESGEMRDPHLLKQEIGQLLPGDISYGHVLAYPETIKLLIADGMAAFFIFRDPRDVVVSHVHYVTDINSKHVHHAYYANNLDDFDQRLETSIRGLPEAENPFPDISNRFAGYLPWLDQDDICALRFEELVEQPNKAVSLIHQFLAKRGFSSQYSSDETEKTLLKGIDPQQSPTFRSGKTGAWRESFSPRHKEIFKSVAGNLLIQLGYEEDQNW
jgi:hypothetical protein